MTQENESSWYDNGYSGMKREQDRLNTLGGPQRYWIKAKAEVPGEFVFVSQDPFCIYEHNPKMNGNFRNWLTCLKGITDEAPCCDELGDKTRYYVGYYTVVDCGEWVDKKGNKYQYELKFLPAKLKSLQKFKRKKEDRGEAGLVGSLFRAYRDDEKSPGIGDEFEYVKTGNMAALFPLVTYKGKKLSELFTKAAEDPVSMAQLKKVFNITLNKDDSIPAVIPTFNYIELLAPRSPQDIKNLLKAGVDPEDGPSSFGSKSKSTTSSMADDVPF